MLRVEIDKRPGLAIERAPELRVAALGFTALVTTLKTTDGRMTILFGDNGQPSRHGIEDAAEMLRRRSSSSRRFRNLSDNRLNDDFVVANPQLPYLHLGLRLSIRDMRHQIIDLAFDEGVDQSLDESEGMANLLDRPRQLGSKLALSRDMLKIIDPFTPSYKFNGQHSGRVPTS